MKCDVRDAASGEVLGHATHYVDPAFAQEGFNMFRRVVDTEGDMIDVIAAGLHSVIIRRKEIDDGRVIDADRREWRPACPVFLDADLLEAQDIAVEPEAPLGV